MEQPTSNPRLCKNNCGFYGSDQYEGMCSKCYRDHLTSSSNSTGRTNSFPRYCGSSSSSGTPPSQTQTVLASTSNMPNISNQQSVHDDQDEVIGRMDEDNIPQETSTNETTVKIDNDELNDEDDNPNQNSESSVTMEDTSKNDSNIDFASPLNDMNSSATAASSIPIVISRNIDIPTKNESNLSLSVMETSSLGAESMSPLMASSVDKKKRARCSWQSCNKKLGLTGFDCRCGGQFCPLHRYTNEHNCTFDYKEHGQHEIRKNMPVVQAPRIRPI